MKLAWRTSQQFWLSHNAVVYSWCSFRFFLSVNHYPREFEILHKKTLATWAQHDKTFQETIAFPDKRKSLLIIQIQETLWRINWTTWVAELAFQKKLKEILLPWRVNLATRVNNNRRKLRCVSRTVHDLSVWNKPLIDTCQYCSTSRANQALRSLSIAGFQNRRVCLQAFPSFPSPSPSPPPLSFFGSRLISRALKTETPLPRSRFAPKPNGNACYAGYQGKGNLKIRGEFELSRLYCIYSVIRGR